VDHEVDTGHREEEDCEGDFKGEEIMTTNELLQDIAYNTYLIEFRLRMGNKSKYKPLTREEYFKGWTKK